jgi:hypothetical protein
MHLIEAFYNRCRLGGARILQELVTKQRPKEGKR